MSSSSWAGAQAARGLLAGGLLGLVGAVVGVVGCPSAAQADSASSNTTANVEVLSQITLTGLTSSLTLTGMVGQTVQSSSPVVLTVTTNNVAGYSVTVTPNTPTLVPGAVGNPDSIPVSAIMVRPSGVTPYTPLIFGTPVEVFHKASASAAGGDQVDNDYQITVPSVRPDAYAGVLTYIASTL